MDSESDKSTESTERDTAKKRPISQSVLWLSKIVTLVVVLHLYDKQKQNEKN